MKLTILAPAAQAELDGAVDWYEARVDGLGLKFMLLVDEAMQEIQKSRSPMVRESLATGSSESSPLNVALFSCGRTSQNTR